MKILKAVTALIVFMCAFSAMANPVQIRVHGLRTNQGSVIINLFKSADSWSGEVPDAIVQISPLNGASAVSNIDLPQGRYMFFLFHDIDGDGQLKRGAFGLPAEPYAFSNNVHIGFSKPSFQKTSFTVGANGAIQEIQLVNP